MSGDNGMSIDDFHCEPKQIVRHRPSVPSYNTIPRANLVLVREHLQNAMQAGLNSEALKCVVNAIKELER